MLAEITLISKKLNFLFRPKIKKNIKLFRKFLNVNLNT
jgi:hypothetical protein